MQLLAEVVAPRALEHRGLVALVALRALDLALMRVVRVHFELVGLLGKLRVSAAVAREAIRLLGRRVRSRLVAGLALHALRDVPVREELAVSGKRRKGKAERRGAEQGFQLRHFPVSPFFLRPFRMS